MNKVYAIVLRHDNGLQVVRVGARDAESAKATVLAAESAPERAVVDVYRWFDDMSEVRQAVSASGSHWFEKSTMRFFRTRVSRDLYAGRYFVTSEENPSGERRYSVRKVVETKEGFGIETVSDFHTYGSRNGAHAAARKAAYQF